jgi:hypothetical protein
MSTNEIMQYDKQHINFITNENISKYSLKSKDAKQFNIDKELFYNNNPTFNWKFYINTYPDLRVEGIGDEQTAIYHYLKHGIQEKRRTSNITLENDCLNFKIPFEVFLQMSNQIYVSDALDTFKNRIMNKFNLNNLDNFYCSSFFFGIYNNKDLEMICKVKNLRIIIWGGEDANFNLTHSLQTIKEIKKLKNCIHLAISDCIHERLTKKDINAIRVDFNMVDYDIYRTIEPTTLGNNIMIFNGQSMGRECVYGEKMYKKIIELRSHFNFIMTNKLNIQYENMPYVYKKCFIMLRLTEHDGNANSVQECKALGIPVVHNQSDYGLKWRTIDDILKHIDCQFDIRILKRF